ncbi:uncharacterized protein [Pyxicephalus adspersus]|uniref:uncharacterized protein n=1 Tax=Pyxicephalus adspersus TaxID=30357 RepID=UPI003B5C5766
MDIQTQTEIIRSFRFDRSQTASQGYKRILIQLFGFLGHGKSSFINTCKYILDGGDYVNHAQADSSDAGRTTARISYPLTDYIMLVDNRGCGTMNNYETGEIFAQLANLLPLDQEVEWSRGFRLVNRIVEAETEILKSDFTFPVFLYSIKMGIDEEHIEELRNLLETAQSVTGVFPFVVLTHKSHGGLTVVERAFRDMGVGKLFILENYTPDDHFKKRGRHEDVLRFFNEVIKEVEFHLKHAKDLAQEFKNHKQLVLKFIFDREMSFSSQTEQNTQAYMVQRMESLRRKSEDQRNEDRQYFEEEMKRIQEYFEELRKKDNLRFEEEMKKYGQYKKNKNKDCILQ